MSIIAELLRVVAGRIIGGDFVGGEMTVNHTEYERSLRREQVKVRIRMLFCDFSVTTAPGNYEKHCI